MDNNFRPSIMHEDLNDDKKVVKETINKEPEYRGAKGIRVVNNSWYFFLITFFIIGVLIFLAGMLYFVSEGYFSTDQNITVTPEFNNSVTVNPEIYNDYEFSTPIENKYYFNINCNGTG